MKFDEEFNKFLAFTLKKGYNEHETREYDFTQLIIIGDQALQILQCLSGEVIKKLGMHELVARPEALVLCTLPVPPSGARINEKDSSSFLTRPQMVGVHRSRSQILSCDLNSFYLQPIAALLWHKAPEIS